jgi:molecular chaperone DnaK
MKINYGIYIGTTSASIAKMEAGVPVVLRSHDKLKDTTPLSVAINAKGSLFVGDKAYDIFRVNSLKSLLNKTPLNAFVEFTRTLGTDKKYFSSNANRSFTSEELLAEVIKRLRSYEKRQDVNAAVLTVPAGYKNNQIDAVRKAGYLAGLKQVEIIQEPIASALAYGLDAKKYNGYSLDFKFESDCFDAALIKVEDGITMVIDSEGDNYLGGNNLDYAIVDQLIIPHIQESYTIDEILGDDNKKTEFKSALKFFAEEIKNNLNFNSSYDIYADPGECCGEDDEGEEIEIDLTVTQEQLKNVIAPIFQKAIDISKSLLHRNNIVELKKITFVGIETTSPILREMITQQLCEPDTSLDPETVIVKGAAIYASMIDLSDELKLHSIDRTKIQIEIGYEPFTNEVEEFVTLKILQDKSEGRIPEKVFAEIKRGDNAWTSGMLEITKVGEVFDVQINEFTQNNFIVELTDENGIKIECEPNTFSIQYGFVNKSTLPYNIGTEAICNRTGKIIFTTIRGLEKNQSLPARGTINSIKTKKDIRPGFESDFIKIPIYQGEHGSNGTRAIYNEHVYDIIISGADLPCLLPKDSDIDLTISIDKSQQMTVQVYFPHIDFRIEANIPSAKTISIETNWLANEIKKAKKALFELKQSSLDINYFKLKQVETDLERIEILLLFDKNENDVDRKQEVLTNLRKILKSIDELNETLEWPKLELDLKEAYNRLDSLSNDLKNDNIIQMAFQFKTQLNEVIKTKDIKAGNFLLQEVIKETNRIESINEKYDREYLQLYENGEMTLFEVKQSLEEVKRQKGRVYQQVLDLIEQENKNITKEKVEDLLFQLTEDGLIPAKTFQEFYEQLSNMNGDAVLLEKLNNDIKAYDSK